MITKHDNPKPMRCSKSNSKREVYRISSCIRKKERSQISDLTSHIKELQKEKTQKKIKMTKPKLVEETK